MLVYSLCLGLLKMNVILLLFMVMNLSNMKISCLVNFVGPAFLFLSYAGIVCEGGSNREVIA